MLENVFGSCFGKNVTLRAPQKLIEMSIVGMRHQIHFQKYTCFMMDCAYFLACFQVDHGHHGWQSWRCWSVVLEVGRGPTAAVRPQACAMTPKTLPGMPGIASKVS